MTTSFSFGAPHATLQQFDGSANDIESLLELLPAEENPFAIWKNTTLTTTNKKKIVTSSLSSSVTADDVTSWFPNDEQYAVFHSFRTFGGECQPSLRYSDLHKCIEACPPYKNNTDMVDNTTTTVAVIAVVLPSTMMAEMAVVLVSLLAQPNVCVAPLDSNMPSSKLNEAFHQLQCQGIVTTQELWDDYSQKKQTNMMKFHDIRVIESSSTMNKVGAVDWTILHQESSSSSSAVLETKDIADKDKVKEEHPVLLLRTSGTTSLPKVVPITASSLLYNATCIAASLQLQRDDVGCNTMPLFHIGGVSCALLAVLVSGSSVVMMGPFDPEAFLDCVTTTTTTMTTMAARSRNSIPTWYYGVPSMHKTLTLTARARLQQHHQQHPTGNSGGEEEDDPMDFLPNRLRFIRSGAAHLPHETAMELSEIFQTQVYPTYSMSEAMPIASSHTNPVLWNDSNNNNKANTVGNPIGCSVRIVNELGNVLPYGTVGEVALFGPGVITGYSGDGVNRNESHTPDGWLRTGDIGELDVDGTLKLKGRVKELIKRGGDQIWPNEVDRVIQQVPGVLTAVTFGVPNDLWGEEVAVAVVIDDNIGGNQQQEANGPIDMKRLILEECKEQLDSSAVPCQIIFLPSTESLLKGPTGKYLRTKLADHLQVHPVDTGALRILNGMAHVNNDDDDNNNNDEHMMSSTKRVTPSSALNGVRFIAACYVVQTHIGLYPNSAWLKLQSFTLDMQIFFILGGFQLACSTRKSVASSWSSWVGTKIGTMHALFIVTQFIALPSFLLFNCGPTGYLEEFENTSCQEQLAGFIPAFVFNTATGMNPENIVNPPAWFQTAFYMFLMLFPHLDAHLRELPASSLVWRLVLNLVIATFFVVFFGMSALDYLILGWLPALVSAMIAGYFFTRYAVESAEEATTFFQNPRVQGVITDLLSATFLLFEVITALSPSCAYLPEDEFIKLRPGEEIPAESFVWENTTLVNTCEMTYDEFVDAVHSRPNDMYSGRWWTPMAEYVGWGRLGTPLVLMWLYSMSHGQGWTVRVMNMQFLQRLAPLAYPLYLLHLPISRYYWIATRGRQALHWWSKAAEFPVPVEWYETFLIIGICLLLGAMLDHFVVSALSRYTVWLGVKVCKVVSRCCCCCCRNQTRPAETNTSLSSSSSNLEKVEDMVKRLTGIDEVARSTNLRDLGLDSLGATALMGTLRASVPAARKLTMQQLSGFETVADLVEALNEFEDETTEIKEIVPREGPTV